jgi:glutamyl-tRNA synthetase/glutamyl-Q tRNA(Asp) synthetase
MKLEVALRLCVSASKGSFPRFPSFYSPVALSVVTRFAPAPTGFLHLGHVLNAIYVWRAARESGGRVLLRIEDHDRSRSRPEYEAAILEDLEWLGFRADGEIVRQSERSDVYARMLEQLRDQGRVYACACSRSDIGVQRYPGTCREKSLPERPGLSLRVRIDDTVERFEDLRLGLQEQSPADQCGDVVVRDRDGNWTYQFAVVIDDMQQGVDLVVRGEDLLDSTGRQIQLARHLGRATPPRFMHHELIMKSPSQKLSKSDGDTGVRELRARGWMSAQVLAEAEARAARTLSNP